MDRLKEALQVESNDSIKLMEVCGAIVLMLHWQRGIIDALVRNNTISLQGAERQNWERVIKNLEFYEEFVWEIVPSRAMLLQLRQFRLTGELEEGFEELSKSDSLGRIEYGLSKEEYDDIEDIIRKLKDARQTTSFYGHAVNLL